MSYKAKAVKLVAKLNRLTQEGTITWDQGSPHPSVTKGSNDVVQLEYTTQYKDKNFRLYLSKYQNYMEEYDKFYWDEATVLEICNEDGVAIWTCPRVNGLWDLFQSVQYQAANVEEILNDILEEDDE